MWSCYYGFVKRGGVSKEFPQSYTAFFDAWAEKPKEPPEYGMTKNSLSAAYANVGRYARPHSPLFHYPAIRFARMALRKHFIDCMGSEELSEEECITRCEKQSSPGWPWNIRYTTKALWLQGPGRQVLKDYWEDLLKEKGGCSFWTVSVKHEIRKLNRIAEEEFRTFSGASAEASIDGARLCGDFNDKFYQHSRNTWSFVGRSKFRLGFHHAFAKLCRNMFGVELDCTQWDSSVLSAIFEEILEFRKECGPANKDYRTRLTNFYYWIVNSFFVMGDGCVWQKETGNPSGSPNTVVDNTLCLFFLLAYVWFLLAPEEFRTYDAFMFYVEALIYGDDNTMSRNPRVASFWTARNIADEFGRLGFIVKIDKVGRSRELNFLNNSVKLRDGYWLPCPKRAKVWGTLRNGCDSDKVAYHLLRALAIRVDCYADEELFLHVTRYCQYLLSLYQLAPYALKISNVEIPYREILNLWFSEAQIRDLYLGLESIGGYPNVDVRHFKNMYNVFGARKSAA